MSPKKLSKMARLALWSLSSILSFTLLSGCSQLSQQVSEDNPKELAPITAKNKLTPSLLWQKRLNLRYSGHKEVYPKIVGDSIIVAEQQSVSAWSKKTGQPLWKETLGQTITGGLGAGNDVIFVGTENGSAVALDSKTGKTRWITLLKHPIVSISSVKEDKVVFRTLNGKLHTLSAKNGELIWQKTQQTPALSLQGASTPILAGPFVITGFDNGSVVAYNLATGKEEWSTKLGDESNLTELSRLVDIDAEMIAIGTALFAVSYQGAIAGIDMRKGKVGWKRKLSSYTGIDATDKELFVTDNQGYIWKLNPLTGEPVWRNNDLLRRAPTAPVIVGSSVVVADSKGFLHWYNRQTGKVIGRIQGDKKGYSIAPLVEGNTLYSIGKSGLLSAHSTP